jgi:ribosomal protein S18 acetylase RimI-like enzyme
MSGMYMYAQKPSREQKHMEITLEKPTKEDWMFIVGLYMHKGEDFTNIPGRPSARIPGETLVAKNKEKLAVGAVTIQEVPEKQIGIKLDSESKLPLANIRTFEVDIEHLRMHIGDQMMKKTLDELKKRGFHTVTIELGHDKVEYREFLKKHGFGETEHPDVMIKGI